MILVKKPCPCGQIGCRKFLVDPLLISVDATLSGADADELVKRWNHHDALLAVACDALDNCSRCNGTGVTSFRTFPGGIEVDNDDQPCRDCAEVRALIDKIEGKSS